MKSDETIIQKIYDLLKTSIPVINKFPRTHKFAIGDRLQSQLTDLMELYIQIFYTPAHQKHELLSKANIKIEIVRHYFRLAYDLGLYSSIKFQTFALSLNEIGKMTGGWIKSLKPIPK